MKLLNLLPLILVPILSGSVLAQEELPREKVKTGILPAGGLYTLYEVSCRDGSTAAIASMERRTRWCALAGEELSCYRQAGQASDRACSDLYIAAIEQAPAASGD